MSLKQSDTNNIKSFFKGSSILLISNICLKAISFFLLPLYTKYLTPEMLGVSDTITTLTGFLLPLLTLGLDSAFSAFYFDDKDEKGSKKVFSTITFTLFLLGFVPLLGTIFSEQISIILFNDNSYQLIISIALASVSFNLWYLPYSLEIRLKNKMGVFGLINISSSLLMIMLNIVFVSVLQIGEMALILSTFFVHLIQMGMYCLGAHTIPRSRYFDRRLLSRMFHFAIPMVPMVVMNWVLTLSDRYILIKFWGDTEVGLYGIATRFVSVVNVFISAVMTAYTTFAFANTENDDAKEQYHFLFNLISLILLAGAFTVSLFDKEIVALMTTDIRYEKAYLAVRDLMFAQVLYGMSTIIGYGIFFKKKSQFALIATSVAAIINLVFNIWLIPMFSISAAAFTTLIGYLVQIVLIHYFSNKVYPCSYGIPKMAITTMGLYCLAYYAERETWEIKAVIWIISAGVVLLLYRKFVVETISLLKKMIFRR